MENQGHILELKFNNYFIMSNHNLANHYMPQICFKFDLLIHYMQVYVCEKGISISVLAVTALCVGSCRQNKVLKQYLDETTIFLESI